MPVVVNIENLQRKRKIEPNVSNLRRNGISIKYTIYAFAYDFNDIGGDNIVVGVEENDIVKDRL